MYLYTIIEKNKTDKSNNIRGNDFCKTLDLVEEELDEMLNVMVVKEDELKMLQKDNTFFKDKVQKCEIDLKLKEKELKELKERVRIINQENELSKSQLREFVLKNAYSSQKLIETENTLQNKEFLLSREIDRLKISIDENQRLIQNKENVIKCLNNDIKNYISIINERDQKITDLKIEMDNIRNSYDEFKKESDLIRKDYEKILSELEIERNKNKKIEEDMKDHEDKFNELKVKGKSLIEQYESKIDSLKYKLKENDEVKKKFNLDLKNLNILINELKNERNHIEDKFERKVDENKRMLIEREGFKEEIYRLNEDNKKLRTDLIKALEENELFTENK